MFASIRAVLAPILILIAFAATANAQSVLLIPISQAANLDPGDEVSFTLVMNFADSPTLGGAFDLVFDSSLLDFVDLEREADLGEPAFSRDPDVGAGLLESWAVASFDPLPQSATLGTVTFAVRSPLGSGTEVHLQDTEGVGGSWIDADSHDVFDSVQYNSIELTAVPEPSLAALLGPGLSGLLIAARSRRRRSGRCRARRLAALGIGLALFASVGVASAEQYVYEGEITSCSTDCNAIAALSGPPTPSFVEGELNIDVGRNDVFSAADVIAYRFRIDDLAGLAVPYDGTNPTIANPLIVDDSMIVLRDAITVTSTLHTFTTHGSTDASGNLLTGMLLFEFITPPFSTNDTWLMFDIATGRGQLCQFVAASGCTLPLNQTALMIGSFDFGLDSDGDGVPDSRDNCTFAPNPMQRDTDADGHGNFCDADFNQSCVTEFVDLAILRTTFFSNDDETDLNGDGHVNITDLAIFRRYFLAPPGPSAAGALCNP